MFSRRIQQQVRHLVSLMIRPLARSGVTANTLTVLGLLLSIVTAVVVAQGFLLTAGLLVLFAGIFDMFDGAMARVSNTATTFGAFIDSTLDRYSESIILFGLLFYTLQRPMLHDTLWPLAPEQQWMIALIFFAAVGSLMVSYAKARAEGLGLECKTGLLARPERVVILALGLLTGATIWALILLAVFSNVTAIERIAHVWRITPRKPVPTSKPVETFRKVGGDGQASHFHLDTMQTEASDGLEPAPIPLANTRNPGSHGNVEDGTHRANAEE